MNPVDLLQFLHGLLGRSPNQSEVTFAQSIHKTIAQLVFNHKSSQTNQELNHSTTSNPVPIITEACNNALKLLLQKGRLPSELQVVSFSQLLKESDALSSRPSTKNITHHGFRNVQCILIARLSHSGCSNCFDHHEGLQLGDLVLRDSNGIAIPCALQSISPLLMGKIILCHQWNYIVDSIDRAKRQGHFEISAVSALNRHLWPDFIPNGLPDPKLVFSVPLLYDKSKQRLRKICLTPKGSQQAVLRHVCGTLHKISPIFSINPQHSLNLVEIKCQDSETIVTVLININIKATEHYGCNHLFAILSLIPIGHHVLISHLKPSSLDVDRINRFECLCTTQSSLVVPISSRSFHQWAGKESPDMEESSHINPTKMKKNQESETENFGSCKILDRYYGIVTSGFNGYSFELDGTYQVFTHRQNLVNGGIGIRNGASIAIYHVHTIIIPQAGEHLTVGFGFCNQSSYRLLEFADSPLHNGKLTHLKPTCKFEVAWWLRKCNYNLFEKYPELQNLGLLENGMQQWISFLTEDTQLEQGPESRYYHESSVLQEWFMHDFGTSDSKLGCQSSVTPFTESDLKTNFPTLSSLNWILASRAIPNLNSNNQSHKTWKFSIHDLSSIVANGLLIGKISVRGTSSSQQLQMSDVLSNQLFFDDSITKIPILILGARMGDLNRLCRIKKGFVIQENVYTQQAASIGKDWVHPFHKYLLCSIKDIEFATPNIIRYPENPKLVFTLKSKHIPSYSKSSDIESLVCELDVIVLIPRPSSIKTVIFPASNQHWFPLLQPGRTYQVTQATQSSDHFNIPSFSQIVEQGGLAYFGQIPEERYQRVRDIKKVPDGFRPKIGTAVSFEALVIRRQQEGFSIIESDYIRPNPYAVRSEMRWFSNKGQITLTLRDLNSPDAIDLFFSPHSFSLPFGLVPGMIARFRDLQLFMSKKVLYLKAVRASMIEIVDIHNSIPRNAIMPSLSLSETHEMFISSVNWDEYNIEERYFKDLSLPASEKDFKVYRYRGYVSKIYKILFESRCSSCDRLYAKDKCTYGCTDTRLKFHAEMAALVDDSTGVARVSVSGDKVFSMLGISSKIKSNVISAVAKFNHMRYENEKLYFKKVQVSLEEDQSLPEDEKIGVIGALKHHIEYIRTENKVEDRQKVLENDLTLEENHCLSRFVSQLNSKRLPSVVILARSYYTASKEDILSLSLPYKVSKVKPDYRRVSSSATETRQDAKLALPNPGLEVVWISKISSQILEEIYSSLNRLKEADPTLFGSESVEDEERCPTM